MDENNFNLFTYENWRDVVGYEGLYQVSTHGRVRSCDRWAKGKCGSMKLQKGKILKTLLDRNGYQSVNLYKDEKMKRHLVHRLVAQTFIPNPQNLPQINHINENKTDNRASNLEWCNRSYNINFGSRNQRVAKAMTNGKLSKRVAQINPQTNEIIKIWPSTNECWRNGFDRSAISNCCRGKYKTHHGYKWQYIEDSF